MPQIMFPYLKGQCDRMCTSESLIHQGGSYTSSGLSKGKMRMKFERE